jgi:vacuolar-type H+-ATPase subunit F/Vma7
MGFHPTGEVRSVPSPSFLSFSSLTLRPSSARVSLPFFLLSCTETSAATLEAAFTEFTERSDIAILLINQHVRQQPLLRLFYSSVLTIRSLQVADQIRPVVEKYEQAFPTLLEIPSKDHPYGSSYSSSLVLLAVAHLSPTQTRRRTPS